MNRVMKRAAVGAGMFVLTLIAAVPASAQVVHSVSFGAGLFAPRSCGPGLANRLDCRASRGSDDVLVENLNTLAFDLRDFRGPTVFGEWHITFDERVEVAFGAGFYKRTVPSLYRDFVDIDLTEIEQDLRLRVIPVSAVVRFMPLNEAGQVQPYIGGGVVALNWKYSEAGEFIDFNNNNNIFEDLYVASGTTIAPVVLGGVRFPINGDVYALNAEVRYQFGKGNLGANSGFLAEKINLGGFNFTLGFQIRF